MTEKEPLSLEKHSSVAEGFTIISCAYVTLKAQEVVLAHMSSLFEDDFEGSFYLAAQYCASVGFERIKHKRARLLPPHLVSDFKKLLIDVGFLRPGTSDFITDEEGLGCENIYWRLVRANSPTDVGPPHADYWFWALGHGAIPESFCRVKTWLPLLQSESESGLLISPGSHMQDIEFTSWVDRDGKRRPKPKDDILYSSLIPAPVRCGEAIIFHDRLIHGGCTGSSLRVSLEWTTAVSR